MANDWARNAGNYREESHKQLRLTHYLTLLHADILRKSEISERLANLFDRGRAIADEILLTRGKLQLPDTPFATRGQLMRHLSSLDSQHKDIKKNIYELKEFLDKIDEKYDKHLDWFVNLLRK